MALPHNIFKKPLIHARQLLKEDTSELNEEDRKVEEQGKRLSYSMIFDQEIAVKERKLIPDDEVEQMLAARDEEWKKRVKLEQIKSHRQGYDKGYQDGELEATEKTRESTTGEVVNSFQGLQGALNHIESNIQELHKEIEPGVCSLVFSIAEQVIGIPVHKKELEDQVKSELERIFKSMDESQKIEIWCSRSDLQYVQSLSADLNLKKIIIETDPELKPGEYRVETNQRKVIRNFKKSLSEMMDQLTIEHWGKSELHSDH